MALPGSDEQASTESELCSDLARFDQELPAGSDRRHRNRFRDTGGPRNPLGRCGSESRRSQAWLSLATVNRVGWKLDQYARRRLLAPRGSEETYRVNLRRRQILDCEIVLLHGLLRP